MAFTIYQIIPVTGLDVFLGILVGIIGYAATPVALFFFIRKHGEDFWHWYKQGLNPDYFGLTAVLLLVSIFWGDLLLGSVP